VKVSLDAIPGACWHAGYRGLCRQVAAWLRTIKSTLWSIAVVRCPRWCQQEPRKHQLHGHRCTSLSGKRVASQAIAKPLSATAHQQTSCYKQPVGFTHL